MFLVVGTKRNKARSVRGIFWYDFRYDLSCLESYHKSCRNLENRTSFLRWFLARFVVRFEVREGKVLSNCSPTLLCAWRSPRPHHLSSVPCFCHYQKQPQLHLSPLLGLLTETCAAGPIGLLHINALRSTSFFFSVTRAIFWYDSSSRHEIVPQNRTCLFQFSFLTDTALGGDYIR